MKQSWAAGELKLVKIPNVASAFIYFADLFILQIYSTEKRNTDVQSLNMFRTNLLKVVLKVVLKVSY